MIRTIHFCFDVTSLSRTKSMNTMLHAAIPKSRSSTSDDDSGCAIEEYAWAPPGLKAEQVRQFFKCLPEEKVPYINSIGEKYRTKKLEEQLPPHDSDPKYCRHLTEEEKNELKIFSEQQRQSALGRGTAKQISLTQPSLTCCGCEKPIESGSIGVHAERGGRNGYWHPQCFSCKTCKEFLANLIYYYKDGDLYCGRHHAELYKPRCSACDEIIFSDECTEAEGYSWHMDHFCCNNCSKRLGGERYVMRSHHPYCLNCFETMYAEYCDTCGEQIQTDQPQMAHESQHWHATDQCFYCYTCRIPLQNRGFFPKFGALYCSNECARQRTSSSKPTHINNGYITDNGPDIIPTFNTHAKLSEHSQPLPTLLQQKQQPLRTNFSSLDDKTIGERQLKSSLRNGGTSSSSYRTQPSKQSTSITNNSGRYINDHTSTGYVSDGPSLTHKRELSNGYMSDGTAARRQTNNINNGYIGKPQVFLQFQSQQQQHHINNHGDRQQMMNMSKSRSREPITFYNDLNLDQLDRGGAALEIARYSTTKTNGNSSSKSSRSSLPDLRRKTLIEQQQQNKYRTNNDNDITTLTYSQETLTDQNSNNYHNNRHSRSSSRIKHFDSNEIMYPISRPKSVHYSSSINQFPRSRSLNGSSRFPSSTTKQHHVRFEDEQQQYSPTSCRSSHQRKKYSPPQNYRHQRHHSKVLNEYSCSSSSSSSDENDDFDNIYNQYDINGNRVKKANIGVKISYVDDCFQQTHATTSNQGARKNQQQQQKKHRRKKDCIIS
ncbi:unnamed protein product [Didymodactylos carnosus]|uniref:Uncharacterized protein n=1 Tax=Didymodactylos carnosus TaxID=1234261 RepID=A0A814E413_9BILA|nr:unnamed protein product [Didymodactylos carnosus]CAF0964337.1 unnamed protein product [Didymodactylos carnosus]CAF3570928.1 unnamed protein product [Didymodactylos carnosus]CAF3738093.1 unnamed protein product [Didymodactylos carnosus]